MMNDTQFFSNKVPYVSGEWPDSAIVNAYWNNKNFKGNFDAGDADDSLTIQDIKDDDTSTHFSIKVIDVAAGDSKTKFNDKYRQGLQAYVDSEYCPTTAKAWLQAILNKSW
jgi:hypothetical protein